MAELFLGYAPGPGGFRKFVVIKRILPTLREEEEFIAMFLDEARISASLSHSNIVQVFDLAEEKNELFIAMEFIAGLDLNMMLRWSRQRDLTLPVGLVGMIVRDAANALHYAHTFTSPSGRALPVIHRDVSLKNIMLTFSGTTKVIDFGIAKAMGSMSNTKAGTVKGSIGYVSPEQIRGEEVTGRSDLFSLAVVLYEALTAERPFAMQDDTATIYRILNHEPPRPSPLLVPEALAEVLMKSLSKDPAARFADGRALAKAIEAALGSELYDEERASRWVVQHFADSVEKTRDMLALAGEADRSQVERAAAVVREQFEAQNHTPSKTTHSAANERTSAELPRFARTATVMVVDDSRVGRMLVERVLTEEGHRVVSAVSGEEALESLAELRPDLIILDVKMPGLDGFEVCARVRSNPSLASTPVVFLSSSCSLDERQQGLQVGGDDFLRKPFSPTELAERVRHHLQRMTVQLLAGSAPS